MKDLVDNSREKLGYGYILETETRNSLKEGTQTYISKIYFDSLEEYLGFLDKKDEYKRFQQNTSLLISIDKKILDIVIDKPQLFIKNLDLITDIIKVLLYFKKNPKPALYIRELPIEIHTKFIEQNKSIISLLLDIILESGDMNCNESVFELRYGLKLDSNFYVYIRYLDDSMSFHGLKEVSIPLDRINELQLSFSRVYIVENRMNYLTFPKENGAVVLWGMGKGVALFNKINFLYESEIYYWGDIDPQGFEILNNLRSYFKGVLSIHMDSSTFDLYQDFVVKINTTKKQPLVMLTALERNLYNSLFTMHHCLRLEQERIKYMDIYN